MDDLDRSWRLSLLLVVIGVSLLATVSGQFSLTGFPYAVKGSKHIITCSYPGATSYTLRSPKNVIYNGASHTVTILLLHEGVWKCDAIVRGIKKTAEAILLTYCNGLYEMSATNYNPSIGDPLELKCKVLNPSGSEVQWIKINGTSAVTTAVAAVQHAKPASCFVYYEPDNRRWAQSTTCQTSTSNQYFNLTINKTRNSDDGYWRCYDYGKSGCFSKPVRIGIARPPVDPPTLSGFNNPIVGTIHTLYCNAWQPFVRPLTYTWYKNNIQLSSGNSSTWPLRPVTKAAQGEYRCEVVDTVKNIKVEATDTLTVYYEAAWNPDIPQKDVSNVNIGGTVTLTLNILVHPLPTFIELYKDENASLQLNYAKTKMSDSKWVITIPSISEEDYGNYTVNVTNVAGSSSFQFQILTPSPPDTPTNLMVNQKNENALVISFQPKNDGGATQHFKIEYYPEGNDGSKEFFKEIEDDKNGTVSRHVSKTAFNLHSSTTYIVRVKAINLYGESAYVEAKGKTGSSGMPPWQLALIGVGALLFLVIIFLVIFFVARRRYTEQPEEARGSGWKKRPISSFVPAGVNVEEKEVGEDNPVMVIADANELDRIEPVEDIPVTRRFYHDLNQRVKTRARESRKSVTSPFVHKELAPVVEEQATGDTYAQVDFKSKTRYKKNQDRQSKAPGALVYAEVDFAKKKFGGKNASIDDDKAENGKTATSSNVGVDGTVYAEVNMGRNRPSTAPKPKGKKKREPEEQTPYAQVDFQRNAPVEKTNDFEMI